MDQIEIVVFDSPAGLHNQDIKLRPRSMKVTKTTLAFIILAGGLLLTVIFAMDRLPAKMPQNIPSSLITVSTQDQRTAEPYADTNNGMGTEPVALKTYQSSRLGIIFKYPGTYTVRDVPDHDSILLEEPNANGSQQEYVFWKSSNPTRLSLDQFYRQRMGVVVFFSDEHLRNPSNIEIYRYTGDVNPYVYIFSDRSGASVIGFAMNHDSHTIDELSVFYQILASIQLTD